MPRFNPYGKTRVGAKSTKPAFKNHSHPNHQQQSTLTSSISEFSSGVLEPKKPKTSDVITPAPKPLSTKRPVSSDDKDDSVAPKRKVINSQHISNPKNTTHFTRLFTEEENTSEVVNAVKAETVKEKVFSNQSFSELKIHPFLIKNLHDEFHFKEMTNVQNKSIPEILAGKDVLIKSQTGSGKTLSFLVPILEGLQKIEPKITRTDGVHAIIISPTRELALQTYDALEILCKSFVRIIPGCIVGGEKRKSEKARIRKGVNILVASPGRLLDHLEKTETLKMSTLRYLVIDEADRLVEAGFEERVQAILEKIKAAANEKTSQLQSILCSATLSTGVERLAGMSLKSPTFIDVSEDPSADTVKFALPENLNQYFVIVPPKLRLVTLAATVLWKCWLTPKKNKMIIFLPTQDSVEFIYQVFNALFSSLADSDVEVDDEEEDEEDKVEDDSQGIKLATKKKPPKDNSMVKFFRLHGEMTQHDRQEIFKTFVKTTSGCLLCTDVAARGVHLPDVKWVIQFSCPENPVTYVHRVGRTARVATSGYSLLFLMPSEAAYLHHLADANIQMKPVKTSTILKHLVDGAQDLNLELPQNRRIAQKPEALIEFAAIELQRRFEVLVQDNPEFLHLARKAFTAYIQSYATYKIRSIFLVKALHLGHVAKSFALRDKPTDISRVLHDRNFDDPNKANAERRARFTNTPHSNRNAFTSISNKGSARHKSGSRYFDNKDTAPVMATSTNGTRPTMRKTVLKERRTALRVKPILSKEAGIKMNLHSKVKQSMASEFASGLG